MEKQKLLKMQELSEATGVSSGTIRFYIQKGILPRPLKTHRNMAYYDATYIERIRAIKELQKKRYLPLNIIKMILESRDFSINGESKKLLKEMDKSFPEDTELGTGTESMTRDEIAERTGLSEKDLESLETQGMIRADAGGRFDPECVRLAELVAELRRIGLTEEREFQVDQLQIHQDLLEFLARKELELFTKRIARKGMSPKEVSDLARNAVNVLNRIIPILHRRMIRRLTEELE